MTKVKFYKQKDGDILAVFPEEIFDNKGNITCYAHIGQHSACSKEYLKGLKLATPSEYNDLLDELIGQGYDDLRIIDARKPLTKILHPVNCRYGAPTGRSNRGEIVNVNGEKVFDSPVPLQDGYDKGGAYWGYPNNLRVKFTANLEYIEFYRKN